MQSLSNPSNNEHPITLAYLVQDLFVFWEYAHNGNSVSSLSFIENFNMGIIRAGILLEGQEDPESIVISEQIFQSKGRIEFFFLK